MPSDSRPGPEQLQLLRSDYSCADTLAGGDDSCADTEYACANSRTDTEYSGTDSGHACANSTANSISYPRADSHNAGANTCSDRGTSRPDTLAIYRQSCLQHLW